MRLRAPKRAAILAMLFGLVAAFAGDAAEQSAAPALDGKAQQARPAPIDRNGVLILIRSTLLAVDHANITGNYTVLRDLGAPSFSEANTAARLAEIFAGLRNQKLDLSGVAVLEPQLTVLPEIDSNGMMRMTGFFPSVPLQVNFDLVYAPVDRRWKLFGIGLNVGQSVPTAPLGAAEPPKSAAGAASAAAPPAPEAPNRGGAQKHPKDKPAANP